MVFWIIGLAGAGKTTIAKALYTKLKKKIHQQFCWMAMLSVKLWGKILGLP